MKRKLPNITDKLVGVSAIALLLALWQLLSVLKVVPEFMLPSLVQVVKAFINDFPLLLGHARITMWEAFLGLLFGVITGFMMAVVMDHFVLIRKSFYPIIVITQTVPTVAIAPLLVLWFGYGVMPKVILIIIVTFFPIAVGLLDGFQSADKDSINLMRAMGATRLQIFRYIKFPNSLNQFFAALRISASYSIVGAVISEWLGGFEGLGVYMTRVKKAYAFDKMFAVIFLISAVSLLLMYGVKVLQRMCMPWEKRETDRTMN